MLANRWHLGKLKRKIAPRIRQRRHVQVGLQHGAMLIGECEAMRCWQAGQNIAKEVGHRHYDQARHRP